jgi:hypothetical protein
VYEQRLGNAVLCGLVGSLRLDPARTVVLPHEEVMPHWVDDRLRLMEATEADLEPILLAYAGAAWQAMLWTQRGPGNRGWRPRRTTAPSTDLAQFDDQRCSRRSRRSCEA